jgi:hypothetical protein
VVYMCNIYITHNSCKVVNLRNYRCFINNAEFMQVEKLNPSGMASIFNLTEKKR